MIQFCGSTQSAKLPKATTCASRAKETNFTVNDEKVSGFSPSLYLNMGKAYEDLAK